MQADIPKAALDRMLSAATRAQSAGRPPVESWNPPFCGDIDMCIRRDGTWHYLGTPIGRPALVKLFASILRRDPEGYRLVTPVEKVGIIVEDAPFLAVEMQVERRDGAQVLHLRTNVDDWVEVGGANALYFETGAADGLKPYVHVRGRLRALLTRALFYDLVALGENRDMAGEMMFGIASGTDFFVMAKASTLENSDIRP